MTKPIIFVDLDGVCADFDSYYLKLFGRTTESVPDKELWKNINDYGTFFWELPVMPMTQFFINTVKQTHEVIILTACPRSDYERAALQKKAWVKCHLGEDIKVLTVLGGKTKYLFMQKPGDILIDDYEKNIEPWISNGGVGIIHQNWTETISQVMPYISV